MSGVPVNAVIVRATGMSAAIAALVNVVETAEFVSHTRLLVSAAVPAVSGVATARFSMLMVTDVAALTEHDIDVIVPAKGIRN